MSRTVIPIVSPTFRVADTEAGLTTGTAYQCQLTSAQLVASPNFSTIPATGCAPAAQSPGASSWALELAWLQDWTAPGGGLSGYAFTHDTEPKWWDLKLADGTVVATGQSFVTSGPYGGEIGGPPAAATATWPCLDKPTIVLPAPAAVGAAEPDDA